MRTAALTGGLLMKSAGVDSDHDGSNETVLDDDLSMGFMGALVFAGGIAMVIAGVTADGPGEPEPVWTPAPIVQPNAPAYAPPPAVTVTGVLADCAKMGRNQTRGFPHYTNPGGDYDYIPLPVHRLCARAGHRGL